MKKLFLLPFLLTASLAVMAQNVGIGTISPSDQLHTTGSVRFQNLSGTGDRPLIVDTAGRLKAATKSPVFRSNAANSNIPIPDNGFISCNGALSTIDVSGIYTAAPNISVRVNISHSFVGDLLLVLVAPNNSDVICLANVNSGNSGDDFTNTLFTDGGATFPSGITGAPFTNVYAPAGTSVVWCNGPTNFYTNKASFAGFGTNMNGAWKLRVMDRATGDIGTLVNWEMSFDGVTPLTQENTLAGNFSIKSGSPAAGKVLTASNTSGYTQWEYPAPYNTAFAAKLAIPTILLSISGAATIPFTVNTAYSDQFDDGSNFMNSANYYKAPVAGVYQFHVHLDINPTTASQAGNLIVRVTGSGSLFRTYYMATATGTPIHSIMFSSIGHVDRNEVIKVEVLNQSGVSLTMGTSSNFSAVRLY